MTRMTNGGALVEMLRRMGWTPVRPARGAERRPLVAFYDAGEALRVIHTGTSRVRHIGLRLSPASGKVGTYAVVRGRGG